MDRNSRVQIALGLLLILLGAWFFAVRRVPALSARVEASLDWPVYVIGAGAVIFLVGLLTGAPAMSIPACIVAGIGGILLYQNQSGDWDSWSFLWSLIPGFVGIGALLTGLLGEDTRHNLNRGFRLLIISAAMLVAFAAIMGRLDFLGPYGPSILLILLGVYVIGRWLLASRSRRAQSSRPRDEADRQAK